MILTYPYAFATIDTEFLSDDGLSVPNTDRFGRTSLNTVYTPLAKLLVQMDRSIEIAHAKYHARSTVTSFP